MKCDTEQMMKLEWLYEDGSEWELTQSLIAQLVRASEYGSMVAGSNTTQANFP